MTERTKMHVWMGLGFVATAVAVGGAVYAGTRLGSERQAPQPVVSSSTAVAAAAGGSLSAGPSRTIAQAAPLPVNRANLTGRWTDAVRGCAGTKLELRRNSYQGETLWDAFRVEAGVADDRGETGEWRVENGKLFLTLRAFVEGDVSNQPETPPTTETLTIRNLKRNGFDEVFDYTGTDGIDHQSWRRLRAGECETPPSEIG